MPRLLDPTANFISVQVSPKVCSKDQKQKLLQLVSQDLFATIPEIKASDQLPSCIRTPTNNNNIENIVSRVGREKLFLKDEYNKSLIRVVYGTSKLDFRGVEAD